MLKRLLALDGVHAVAKFREDGEFVEGYGILDESSMRSLCKFALGYKRITQGNTDQLSMFTQMRGWTPPKGWVVRGQNMSVCSIGNIVCFMSSHDGSLSEVLREVEDLASY